MESKLYPALQPGEYELQLRRLVYKVPLMKKFVPDPGEPHDRPDEPFSTIHVDWFEVSWAHNPLTDGLVSSATK